MKIVSLYEGIDGCFTTRQLDMQLEDLDWQHRNDSGENLLRMIKGEHWESKAPSTRTTEDLMDYARYTALNRRSI